ncbi:hypothetical protein GBA52_010696 [Prunus armeniaca]|nr:hypothetical protein GBA52_010696 [Prunus armeniaca]
MGLDPTVFLINVTKGNRLDYGQIFQSKFKMDTRVHASLSWSIKECTKVGIRPGVTWQGTRLGHHELGNQLSPQIFMLLPFPTCHLAPSPNNFRPSSKLAQAQERRVSLLAHNRSPLGKYLAFNIPTQNASRLIKISRFSNTA